MRRWFAPFALALIAAAAPIATPGTQTAQPAVRNGDYPYQLFVPRGYEDQSKNRWPLMIFLHGSGERGSDVEKVKLHGPPEIVASHPGFPFILVSPLLEADGDWDTTKLARLLRQVRKDYHVDRNRIYLTGLSRGGHAAWRWAAERPDLFAAVAPVAGTGNTAAACRLKDTPVWAFHGDNDDIVRPIGSFAMVEAIRQCPSLTAQPVLTIFPATNHNSWDQTYRGDALYRWFLEQRRATPAPKQ